jgi:hypothetical protein
MQIDDNKRPRAALKTYFAKNAIPTEAQFAQLIDSNLNQRDDGFVKNPGDPLSIEATGDDVGMKKALSFYMSFADADPAWSVALKPRARPNDPATARAGWSVNDAGGNSRLAIDAATGNVGIGTVQPGEKLEVAGRIKAVNLTVGPWPASPGQYVFFGANTLDQGNAGNYALLQSTGGGDVGATFVNSPRSVSVRINNGDQLVITPGSAQFEGAVRLANSDLYFTEVNHDHTGLGNAPGNAAIENAKNYGALMILGRSNPSGGALNRMVKLWDHLQVNGPLEVVGDLSYTGAQNQLSVKDNFTATVKAADFRIGFSGRIGTRGMGSGRALVDYTDTLILNCGPDWPKTVIDGQTTITHLASGSSRTLKDDIAPLSSATAADLVEKLAPVSFTWKTNGQQPSLGFIAEDCPTEVLTPEGDAIYYAHIVAALTRCVKDQGAAIDDLTRRLAAVAS